MEVTTTTEVTITTDQVTGTTMDILTAINRTITSLLGVITDTIAQHIIITHGAGLITVTIEIRDDIFQNIYKPPFNSAVYCFLGEINE